MWDLRGVLVAAWHRSGALWWWLLTWGLLAIIVMRVIMLAMAMLGMDRLLRLLVIVYRWLRIVRANFNIIDQVVAEIDGSWEIRRETHVAIDDEADMMGAGADVDDTFEVSWLLWSSHC